jgi:hypothetical protein
MLPKRDNLPQISTTAPPRNTPDCLTRVHCTLRLPRWSRRPRCAHVAAIAPNQVSKYFHANCQKSSLPHVTYISIFVTRVVNNIVIPQTTTRRCSRNPAALHRNPPLFHHDHAHRCHHVPLCQHLLHYAFRKDLSSLRPPHRYLDKHSPPRIVEMVCTYPTKSLAMGLYDRDAMADR